MSRWPLLASTLQRQSAGLAASPRRREPDRPGRKTYQQWHRHRVIDATERTVSEYTMAIEIIGERHVKWLIEILQFPDRLSYDQGGQYGERDGEWANFCCKVRRRGDRTFRYAETTDLRCRRDVRFSPNSDNHFVAVGDATGQNRRAINSRERNRRGRPIVEGSASPCWRCAHRKMSLLRSLATSSSARSRRSPI
jgi:hypothetical protein